MRRGKLCPARGAACFALWAVAMKLTTTFQRFFASEKSSGIVLIACTLLSLVLANSGWGAAYLGFWQKHVAGLSIEHWINDALMAVFFLLIGLELERELYVGELADIRNALLPIIAAVGGIVVPSLIHLGLNIGTPTQAGTGIPMATDIAFALGALALLGRRIPPALKVFLTALAVMDDLGAIIVIAVFYSDGVSLAYLLGALGVFALLLVCNRVFRLMVLWPYLLAGVLMWFLMLRSGVHATIAGVLLAFAIPFADRRKEQASPSQRLEHALHQPAAFLILPLFALANTGVVLTAGWQQGVMSANGLGIVAGLALGKPLGISLLSFVAVLLGLCRLPAELRWGHIFGAGLLGGIGFTMSIFITNLAFAGQVDFINASKMAVLLASLLAGCMGLIWLRLVCKPVVGH